MNRRLLLAASLVALLAAQSAWVLSSQSASAQATPPAKPPGALKAQRVQGDLHMITGEGGNVAVLPARAELQVRG